MIDREVPQLTIRVDHDNNFRGIFCKMTNAAMQGEAFSYVSWVSSNDNIGPKIHCNGRGPVSAIISDHQQPIPVPKLKP